MPIFLIFSTLLSVGQKIMAARAEQESLNAQAKQTQDIADANIERENEERRQTAREQARGNRRRQAMIRSAYAKSGVAMKGTPALMLREQIRTDEENMILGDNASQDRNSMTDWTSRLEAKGLRTQGKQAMLGGVLGAVGSAAGGVMKYNQRSSTLFEED